MTADQSFPELREIGRDECLLLVASASVGRLAVVGPTGAPHVVPVNFVVDQGRIYFRSDEGTKLTAALTQLCTFQVDEIDLYRHVGWSVMIHGRVTEADSLPPAINTWVRPGRHILCLEPTEISGRRIALAEFPFDDRGYL